VGMEQQSAEFKAGVAIVALSGEKTLLRLCGHLANYSDTLRGAEYSA